MFGMGTWEEADSQLSRTKRDEPPIGGGAAIRIRRRGGMKKGSKISLVARLHATHREGNEKALKRKIQL